MIFCGRLIAGGMPHDSADRGGREAARDWAPERRPATAPRGCGKLASCPLVREIFGDFRRIKTFDFQSNLDVRDNASRSPKSVCEVPEVRFVHLFRISKRKAFLKRREPFDKLNVVFRKHHSVRLAGRHCSREIVRFVVPGGFVLASHEERGECVFECEAKKKKGWQSVRGNARLPKLASLFGS